MYVRWRKFTAFLVGYSMGAGEVVRYVTRYGSDRIARIALVAATLPFLMKTANNPDGLDISVAEVIAASRAKDRPKWFADNAPPCFGVGLPGISVSPELMQWGVRMCLQCSPKATIDCFHSTFTTDFRADMQELAIPALIIHGESDQSAFIDLCGRRSAKLVPDNQFIVYEGGAAHGLFITHADRLNADLLSFIKSKGTFRRGVCA